VLPHYHWLVPTSGSLIFLRPQADKELSVLVEVPRHLLDQEWQPFTERQALLGSVYATEHLKGSLKVFKGFNLQGPFSKKRTERN
jgi:hypothetical protein